MRFRRADGNNTASLRGSGGMPGFGHGRHACLLRAAILALMIGASAPAAAADLRIVVLAPEGDATVDRVLAGVRASLAGQPVSTRYLSPTRADMLDSLRRAEEGTVFLGLGQRAADDILRTRSTPALVGCLLPAGAGLSQGDNVKAIPPEVSPELQATWLRRLHGQARRVGLLYDPDLSARQVGRLAEALQRAGLQALPEPVHSPTELPAALGRLSRKADVILGINDRTVFTPQTAKAILLYSFRARIPVIGLTDAWVKAGALYALEPDYEDLGRHCGLAALKMTGLPRELPQQPARLVLSINLRTARHMRIDWPSDILHMASKTHE